MLPQEETLSTPPSTVLPASTNKSLPTIPTQLAEEKANITGPETETKAISAPSDNPTGFNSSEDKEDKEKEEYKKEDKSSLGGTLLAKADLKAAPRAPLKRSQFDEEQDKIAEAEDTEGRNGETVESVLAKIPPGARCFAQDSLKVTLDKDAYECLGSRRWLSGGVMIALLSLLFPPPDVQVFYVDTVTDPKTGRLVEGRPETICIGPETRKLIFAHCSHNHWVTIEIRIGNSEGRYWLADWYCSLGQPYRYNVVDFYCKLVEQSLQQTAALPNKGSVEWHIVDRDCAKQPKGDSSNCGIFVLYNISRLVNGCTLSLEDRVDPGKLRLGFACRINEYIRAHDAVPMPSGSPLLYSVDPSSLTNAPNTDLPMGDAMNIDKSLDISKPADENSKVPVSPAPPVESLLSERLHFAKVSASSTRTLTVSTDFL